VEDGMCWEEKMCPPMWSESRTSIIATEGFVVGDEEVLVEEEEEEEVRRSRRWVGEMRGSVAIVGVDMLDLVEGEVR